MIVDQKGEIVELASGIELSWSRASMAIRVHDEVKDGAPRVLYWSGMFTGDKFRDDKFWIGEIGDATAESVMMAIACFAGFNVEVGKNGIGEPMITLADRSQ